MSHAGVRINNLARLKSALSTSGLQHSNADLHHVINELISETQRLYNIVLPTSHEEDATVAVPQINQAYLTHHDETETLSDSKHLIFGAGLQKNDTGKRLIISAAYPFPIDGKDGKDGIMGPPGPQGIQGIPGGGGGSGITQIEQNLGSTPVSTGRFVVADATITGTSKILIQQSSGPYTGKGTRADEAEMDQLWCFAAPAAGSMTVHWRVNPITSGRNDSLIRGNQPIGSANTQSSNPYVTFAQPIVLGKVKGNFKFNYSVGA